MKIAVMGTESNSVHLAPFGDPSWQIWGCSPGLYPIVPRVDAWFELHRWEPPVIGQPSKQVPWFTPEYVAWMDQRTCPVWMNAKVPEVRGSVPLPVHDLTKKYGYYFFTSSIAWMLAMAIDTIEADREKRAKKATEDMAKAVAAGETNFCSTVAEPDCIGLWGIDMSAEEEYMWQRPGCHFFITLAHARGIRLVVPEESDILCPPPLYAISESWHRQIKFLARTKMMQQRQRMVDANLRGLADEAAFIKGVLQDNEYHRRTWIHDQDVTVAHIPGIMLGKHIFEDPANTPEARAAAKAAAEQALGREVGDILATQPLPVAGEAPATTVRRLISESSAKAFSRAGRALDRASHRKSPKKAAKRKR